MHLENKYAALAAELEVDLIRSIELFGPILVARRGDVAEVVLGPESVRDVARRGINREPSEPWSPELRVRAFSFMSTSPPAGDGPD